MTENKKYYTVKTITEGLYKDKGSKFLSFVLPCDNESNAKEIINQYRKNHPGAVHVCFAWRFGSKNFKDRYSDDGEPSGSAGKPIFGQILSANLTNVLMLVVRYYGGVNLGVGGLMRAYKSAIMDALINIECMEVIEKNQYSITFNYEYTGTIMQLLDKTNCEIINQTHVSSGTELVVDLPTINSTIFENEIAKYHQINIKQITS